MMTEQNYDFLKRMRVVHQPKRRDASATAAPDEASIDGTWRIVFDAEADALVRRAALDLQNYLLISMEVAVVASPTAKPVPAARTILVTTAAQPGLDVPAKSGGFAWSVGDGAVLCGADARGCFRGVIHLEAQMNLREAPFLKQGAFHREPLMRMRSVHSGCGIDDFPDWQLDAIAHAGFTAIDLFVKAPDTTTRGYCNINDVITRALAYGLDTVIYSYLSSYKHPDDADAEEFFDGVYGEIFRRYPDAAAIHLVGESLEFPSKDPHTTGKRCRESRRDGIPDPRPSPGWYPCYDYPAYLKRICDAVHKVKPSAEVIINTYNWGWTPLEVRRKFLEQLPPGITVQATYDIFKANDTADGLHRPTMDYSISAAEPGYYFTSEAEAAHAVGIGHVRVTSNCGGATWDFGTIPYVPVPFRFARRMAVLRQYHYSCGVDSLYENHHYGWWPNPCNDLAREYFAAEGDLDAEAVLTRVAKRDYGADAAAEVVAVWRIWSDAMDHYIGSNEDQYGPWRTGPSYPFIFQPNITRTMDRKEIQFPTAPHAHFGYKIIRTLYQPYENENQSPGPLRLPHEIRELEEMLKEWNAGLERLAAALGRMAGRKREAGDRLYALGKFCRNSIVTTLNMKHWWLLNMRLQVQNERAPMLALLDEIEALAQAEIANTRDTVDAVRVDSRLGWEPSMEYVCDEWHLDWKLRQMESMLREVAAYRKTVEM